jgi:thymidylate synthase ThyX
MLFAESQELYDDMLDAGIAKECARKVLPMNSPSRIYMTGTLRSWMHYTDLRASNGTQKEHMDIANDILDIFAEQFPAIYQAIEEIKGEPEPQYVPTIHPPAPVKKASKRTWRQRIKKLLGR